MKYIKIAKILWQFGFPVAKAIAEALHDGKVTRDEIYNIVNAVLGAQEEVVFWEPKKV